MSFSILTGLFIGAALVGYLTFLIILKILPTRLMAGNLSQKDEVLIEAKKHADAMRRDSDHTQESKFQILKEEVESSLGQREEDLKLSENDLDEYEKQLAPLAARIQKLEHEMAQVEQHSNFAKGNYEDTTNQLNQLQSELRSELEKKSRSDSGVILKNLTDNLSEIRHLEAQKLLKLQTEELSNAAKRIASRFLGRSMARYAPEFPWPKMTNTVDVENQKFWDILASDSFGLLAEIKEVAGIEAEFMPARYADMPGIVKLSGGMGVEREAAKLTLSELLKSGQNNWPKLKEIYTKQRSILDAHAIKLGRQAANELQLDGLHIEVIRLIGFLN
ncbi:MAG: Rnase Y domain-containing protein, partial [Proteobacteria bacterium]|nr:Rnase Y domain-containing protein [Pseudomonadota bacterium]